MHQHPHSPEYDGDTVVSAVDWLGNRFAVGDTVMYCISAGRGQMMALGEVVQIQNEVRQTRELRDPEPGEEPDWIPYARPGLEPGPGKVSVWVPWDLVTVQVRTLKTSGHWNNEKRTKPAWVNPMNITALKSVGML